MREIRRQTRKKYSAAEKIRIVISGLRGEHSIAEPCRREGIAESLYCVWSKEFMEAGKKRLAGDTERQASSGVMKAANAFRDKTTAPNQLWQTDVTYLKVIGWGWFYLSTILDDFSHFIVAWKLCTTMKAADVTETVERALAASGLDGSRHRPRLLSDNGSSYVAGDLATWLGKQNINHVRGAPNHPMTQGKIERWHQTMKNRILLENHCRYHESLGNLTPRPTSTPGAVRPFWNGEKRSSERPSSTTACCTGKQPPKLPPQMRRSLP